MFKLINIYGNKLADIIKTGGYQSGEKMKISQRKWSDEDINDLMYRIVYQKNFQNQLKKAIKNMPMIKEQHLPSQEISEYIIDILKDANNY